MKKLDFFLQNWRTKKAQKWIPKNARLLDVGCANAPLRLTPGLSFYVGVDPEVETKKISDSQHLISGTLDLSQLPLKNFDCVTMLAVWEHLTNEQQRKILIDLSSVLPRAGRVILTIPEPAVDHIIDALKAVGILDGMKDEEHHGFKISETEPLFKDCGFNLEAHERFQLGLNHLFVFAKKN